MLILDTDWVLLMGCSSSIRVDIEPICACGNPNGYYGTAWHFTVYCWNSIINRQTMAYDPQTGNAKTIESCLSDKADIENHLYAN
jgi:hypothetical protein